MKPLVQVFIATYNRPTLVLNAVNSVLQQDFSSFEVIVSDNSTNDQTESILKKISDTRFSFKKRKESLPVIDHLNAILQDVTSDYFMIFHDDDIMNRNLLSTLYNKITRDSNIIAVGSNAIFIKNGKAKLYNKNLKKDTIITDKNVLIGRYLIYDIVPFPSYLYCKKVAEKSKFDFNHGGKYCDASFIISLLNYGSILFVAAPLMNYNLHSGQDSSVNDFTQKISLINFYINNSDYSNKHPLIIRFRIQNIFVEFLSYLKQKKFFFFEKRNLKIISLIFKASPIEYFPRLIYAILKTHTNKYLK